MNGSPYERTTTASDTTPDEKERQSHRRLADAQHSEESRPCDLAAYGKNQAVGKGAETNGQEDETSHEEVPPPHLHVHDSNEISDSFDDRSEPQTRSSETYFFDLENADSVRDAGIAPLHRSSYQGSETTRAEFILGAEALGFNTEARPLLPQQYKLADIIGATRENGRPLHKTVGVCMSRRTAKTTTLFCVALGRAWTRPDYAIAYTAQSGQAARQRLLIDVINRLERQFPDVDSRDFVINRSPGATFIQWSNGSRLSILSPSGEAFRSNAYDFVIVDESQSVEPGEATDELLGGIRPTMSTRPGAQLIIAGSAGESRSGLLWQTLEAGREGKAGICEFGAPDGTYLFTGDSLPDDFEGSTADPNVWLNAHPGIGTLTDLETITEDYDILTPEAFSREYLSIWPQGVGSQFLSAVKWAACGLDQEFPAEPPKGWTLSMSAEHDGNHGTIMATWRDSAGRAHIAVLAHRKGTIWMTAEATRLSRLYKTPVVYDIGHTATKLVADGFARATARPLTNPVKTAAIPVAHAGFVRELETMNLRHYNQGALNDAVPLIVKRKFGQDGARWALGRTGGEGDISAIEAAAIGIWAYDKQPVKTPLPRMTAA